jgi:hypothetical protein
VRLIHHSFQPTSHRTHLSNDDERTDNAYVAGMKEDLELYGNELAQLQTMYIIGAAVGQIPFLFIFTYVPMYWLVPGMDICWGIATLLQFRAQSYAEMAAYRFLVGWFEVCLFGDAGDKLDDVMLMLMG